MVPFYRAGKYIAEAIESVLSQQYTDWRLYLINDGSDDSDVEIARRFTRMYPGAIELLEHPRRIRRGISASRNLGIRHAQGDLIAFLDADDTWYPHRLRAQVPILDSHPLVALIYGPALRWHSWNGGFDEAVSATVDGFGSDCIAPGPALLGTFLRDEAKTPCPSSVLIRRPALERVGCFEEQFRGLYDDQVLYAKLCMRGDIYVSSDCVSRYRIHSESCCGQAEASGVGSAARDSFLSWLREYRQEKSLSA